MKNNERYQVLEDMKRASQKPRFGWLAHGEKVGK